MKKNAIIIGALLVFSYACNKKTDDVVPVVNSQQNTSGGRGDTLIIEGSDLDKGNLTVKIYSKPATIIERTDNYIKVIVPWVEYTKKLETISIQNDSDYIYSSVFTLKYNPRLEKISDLSNLNYGDTVTVEGKDLEVYDLDVIFNTLRAKIASRTTSCVKVIVPDSCGMGDLSIIVFNKEDLSYKNIVLAKQQPYTVPINNTITTAFPKKITFIIGDKTYSRRIYYNIDNKIDSFQPFNRYGGTVPMYKFIYDNNYNIKAIQTTYGGKISTVDSIYYSNNTIIQKIYDFINYGNDVRTFKHVFDKNVISQVSILEDTRTYKFSDGKCSIFITSGRNIGLEFDTKNRKHLFQPKYSWEINDFTDYTFDYLSFPGNVKYIYTFNEKGDVLGTPTEIELYYNIFGHLVKEKYYQNDFGTAGLRRVLKYIVLTEY